LQVRQVDYFSEIMINAMP